VVIEAGANAVVFKPPPAAATPLDIDPIAVANGVATVVEEDELEFLPQPLKSISALSAIKDRLIVIFPSWNKNGIW
jgi:hypothetical protein